MTEAIVPNKSSTLVQRIHAEVIAARGLSKMEVALARLAEASESPDLKPADRELLFLETTRLRQQYVTNLNTWWVAIIAFFFSSYREGIVQSKEQFDAFILELAKNAPTLSMGAIPTAPVGLSNRGNTCFMNAALQAALAGKLLSGSTPLDREDVRKMLFGAALQQLSEQQAAGKVSPDLLDYLRDLAYETGIVQSERGQEDVAEFFGQLLNVVGSTPIRFQRTNTYTYPDSTGQGLPLQEQGREDSTSMFIVRPHPTQSLEPGSNVYDLNHCLQLEVDEGRETTARPQETDGPLIPLPTGTVCHSALALREAPSILPIQVSRYGADLQSRRDFSVQNTEILTVALQSGETATYMLKAVCVHQGDSLSAGHYYAYVYNSDGTWTKCNDSRISRNDSALEDIEKNGVLFIYALKLIS